MVVDYNRFTPGQGLVPGTLWVCEQVGTLPLHHSGGRASGRLVNQL
jgi:hypothetical protein